MISSWALWILAYLGLAGVILGVWIFAYQRGYARGLGERIGLLPGDAWKPESEAEFMSELLDGERRRPDKYHEGK